MLNELRKFQVIAIFLLFACGMLIVLSINTKKTTKDTSIKTVSSGSVVRKNEVYGYSDILDLISKDESIKVCNMSAAAESKELLRVSIEYTGTLIQFYNTLNSFSSEGCFHSVETVRVESDETKQQSIGADLLFIMNR